MEHQTSPIRAHMTECAMRYDTLMAWAFRRALGLQEAPRGKPRAPKAPRGGRYEGARQLMAQRYGAGDRRRFST